MMSRMCGQARRFEIDRCFQLKTFNLKTVDFRKRSGLCKTLENVLDFVNAKL